MHRTHQRAHTYTHKITTKKNDRSNKKKEKNVVVTAQVLEVTVNPFFFSTIQFHSSVGFLLYESQKEEEKRYRPFLPSSGEKYKLLFKSLLAKQVRRNGRDNRNQKVGRKIKMCLNFLFFFLLDCPIMEN